MRRAPLALALASTLALSAGAARAVSWTVDSERSTFAVLTHRAGIGARLAHEHLIVARGAAAALDFDPAAAEATRFTLELPVLALEVDPAAERAALAARLQLLGALAEELPPVDEDDRAKIRRAMLGAGQLAAERFPGLRAELLAVERRGAGGDGGARVALGWNARVRFELRGMKVETTVPLRWELEDGELHAELLGELRFTDFGIEPYSAALGAIRNADLFHVYVDLVARPAAP